MKPVEQLARHVEALLRSLGVNRPPVGVTITFAFGPPVQLPLEAPEPSEGSNDLQDLILDALAESETPLKTSAIARRIDRKYDGHFRRVVKALRDAGEIMLTDGAYSLAED